MKVRELKVQVAEAATCHLSEVRLMNGTGILKDEKQEVPPDPLIQFVFVEV